MNIIQQIQVTDWQGPFVRPEHQTATSHLEQGKVLYFPDLPFQLQEKENTLLSPHCLSPHSKNVSLHPTTRMLSGMAPVSSLIMNLQDMMDRFSAHAQALVNGLLPHYKSHLILGRTSYRPAEIAGRSTSYRKDDTRLHVDAFPASPTQGNRILRVFSNINPHGQNRVWRLGEPFEDAAKRFLPQIRRPLKGSSALLKILKLTRGRRTAYDHYMLNLHDMMKGDLSYQRTVPQIEFQFPPHSSWIVMTDHVSHAAMSGQYVLEQTFYLPVAGMQDQNLSPLRVLERLTGKRLV